MTKKRIRTVASIAVATGIVVLVGYGIIFRPSWVHQQCVRVTDSRPLCAAIIPLDRLGTDVLP